MSITRISIVRIVLVVFVIGCTMLIVLLLSILLPLSKRLHVHGRERIGVISLVLVNLLLLIILLFLIGLSVVPAFSLGGALVPIASTSGVVDTCSTIRGGAALDNGLPMLLEVGLVNHAMDSFILRGRGLLDFVN